MAKVVNRPSDSTVRSISRRGMLSQDEVDALLSATEFEPGERRPSVEDRPELTKLVEWVGEDPEKARFLEGLGYSEFTSALYGMYEDYMEGEISRDEYLIGSTECTMRFLSKIEGKY